MGTNGQPVASNQVKEMMIENAGQILASFYSGIFSSLLQNLSRNIPMQSF